MKTMSLNRIIKSPMMRFRQVPTLLSWLWLILLYPCEKIFNKIVVVVVAEPFSYDVQVCTETFHFQENVMKNEDNTFSYLKIRIFVKPFVKTVIPLVNIAGKYSIWCLDEVSDFNDDNKFDRAYECYSSKLMPTIFNTSSTTTTNTPYGISYVYSPHKKLQMEQKAMESSMATSININFFNSLDGKILATVSLNDIKFDLFNIPCDTKSTSRKISYYNNRPKLFSSFRFSTTTSDDVDNNEKIEEKEYDCIIEYNESTFDATKRFALQHQLDNVEHQKYIKNALDEQVNKKYNRKALLKNIIFEKYQLNQPINLIFGASFQQIEKSNEYFDNSQWIPLSINDFDILSIKDYEYYFDDIIVRNDMNKMDNSFPLEVIDSIMAEHVFEHLNTIDTIYALKLLTKYLKKYGYIRIAVPDWNINYFNETEQKYYEDIKDGHFIQYNYKNIQDVFHTYFTDTYELLLQEYTDDNGVEIYGSMDPRNGMITRSKCFDKRGVYSLVVDAIKVYHDGETIDKNQKRKFPLYQYHRWKKKKENEMFLSFRNIKNITFGLADDMFTHLIQQQKKNHDTIINTADEFQRFILICEMILVQDPCHYNTLHFLGMLYSQSTSIVDLKHSEWLLRLSLKIFDTIIVDEKNLDRSSSNFYYGHEEMKSHINDVVTKIKRL